MILPLLVLLLLLLRVLLLLLVLQVLLLLVLLLLLLVLLLLVVRKHPVLKRQAQLLHLPIIVPHRVRLGGGVPPHHCMHGARESGGRRQ